ncbi:DMT family transporter [Marinomonas sp.]|nr:DMT family transporter [Marinomonas sp.]MDB4837208.1 DMT family transporter [Marinomonas sp.]
MNKVLEPNVYEAMGLPVSPFMKGCMAMTLVLLVWSGFALTVRGIGVSPLTIADVMLIRFLVPLVLLIPWAFSYLDEIRNVRLSDVVFILLGGVPFILLASLGAKTAPTAYIGIILAGTPPIFVALLSFALYRTKITAKKRFSLSIILAGVIAMIAGNSEGFSKELMQGIGYLFTASLVWSGYTVGLRRAKLHPMVVAIVLSYASFLIVLASTFMSGAKMNLGQVSFSDALPFILVQGLGVGVLATICFSYAVNHLGSSKVSVIGSISPCLTALFAVFIFSESLTMTVSCGIVLSVIGVILSSRS